MAALRTFVGLFWAACMTYIFSANSPARAQVVLPPNLVDERLQIALIQLRDPKAGIPGISIPDPMPLRDLETAVNQGIVKASVSLWNSSVSGLSTFEIAKVRMDLVNLEVGLQLNVSELLMRGNYSLSGTVTFMRVKGNGHFWMKMLNATLLGRANLTVTDEGKLEISTVLLDIKVQRIQLHFDNLLGRGFVSSLSNSLLNALSKIIFENIKPFILQKMQVLIKDAANAQLDQLPPEQRLLSALTPLDLVIARSAKEIKSLKFDPYVLPTRNQSFTQQILFFTASGKVALFDGFVEGLSTLHRTGNIDVAFANNTLQLSANLGFDEIGGGYKWLLNFMGIEKIGGVHFKIGSVNARIVIEQINRKAASPRVRLLEITDIYQLQTDVDGLGSADLILEFFANFVTNIFKFQLSKIVEGPIAKIVQKNLDGIKLPF